MLTNRTFKSYATMAVRFLLGIYDNVYSAISKTQPSVYFCYNQSIHHIHHSIYIAIELSLVENGPQVIILSTSAEATRIIRKELSGIANNIVLRTIWHPGYSSRNYSVNLFVLLCRLHIHNPTAVVVTDYYDNVLRQLGLNTFWIYTAHGPENRGYTHEHVKDYDLVIVPGPEELERLESAVGKLNNYEVIGYSKFDYFLHRGMEDIPPYRSSKPVIMYNPHFDRTVSSFYSGGKALLKALSETKQYNVIFMPHPDLSRKHPKLIRRAADIAGVSIVDRPDSNIEHMAKADLYITDVSSATFEWLYFDRPAVFYNPDRHKGIFPAWNTGPVVEDAAQIVDTVEKQLAEPDSYREQRHSMFEATFVNRSKNVSQIAAKVIWAKIREPHP